MITKLIKELPRAIFISTSIFLVLLIIRFLSGVRIEFNSSLLINFGYTTLYGFMLYYANAILFMKLDEIFSKERFNRKRILIGFIGSFIISVGVIFLLRIFEDVIIEGSSFALFFEKEKFSNYLVTIIITFVVTLAFHAFYLYKAYQETRLKEQKIIAGTANAKFESLKNQIDPHFLFNSLNVLSSLIEENPENAQQFTTSLSKIYRYVLEQKDKELVTVSEELAFAKTYMKLLKMRFENSITFELPTDFENPDAKVVPLSLQLLLENTIKHNVVSENKPLHIKIYLKDNFLVVENNLQKKEVLQDRKGVGLQNIVSRYAILSERKVLIDETKETFAVYLPILTKQISIMETTNTFNENTSYLRAKERVEKIKGFYGNLASYCVVIPILIIINLTTNSRGFQWFWFPMLGWGLGVLFHAFETFGYGKSWEEKKIQEILNKQNNTNNKWK
ncbi:2TM domain-containing protein [Flavobacterium sp.]|uniref:2TM domain-containing protein n=1 Tax=Flavobacterium sp. TaxID=239 RepID=UPI0026349FD9|nr:2TM domain-containing protein [Flavobacterium sp.]